MLRRSMADLERELEPAGFCRVHRSTIVNLERVRNLATGHDGEPEIVMRDATKLSVSRGYREKLQLALQEPHQK